MGSMIASLVAAAGLAAIQLPEEPRPYDSGPDQFRSEAEKLALIDRALAPWLQVTRWMIEYEVVPIGDAAGSPTIHLIMAVAAPGQLYQLAAHSAPGYPPWQLDPYCLEFFIHQGRVCKRWPFTRAYVEVKMNIGDTIRGELQRDILLTFVPRWPISDYRLPVGGSELRIAAEALRSADYRLLPTLEAVGGEECFILDNKGVDRIWAAAGKGLSVMRRDFRDPRSGKLLRRILTDDLEQVGPGLWLPTKLRSQLFRESQSKNEDLVGREYKVNILRCVLNDEVPDSTFIPVHRPGSMKNDDKQPFTQVSPGGEDVLDDVVDFMIKYARLPTKPIPRRRAITLLLVGLASGLFAGFFLFPLSRRRARRSLTENRHADVPEIAAADGH